jgi:hypothetical protein
LYLLALYALIVPLWRITPAVLPAGAFWFFLAASVWVETFHMVEHGVIIGNVISNGGCPYPGIGDRALGVSDTVLHFFYNGIAYTGILVTYFYVLHDRGLPAAPPRWRAPREPHARPLGLVIEDKT